MNPNLQYEITQFYYQEAYYLDHREYDKWLEMLSDDIEYSMPLRVTVDNKMGTNIDDDMTYLSDNKADLKMKVERLFTKSAWVDNPATRQRHYITNVMIEAGSKPDEYKVRSSFLYRRSRSSDPETEEIFGEREDTIQKIDGEWKLISRTIYPDQTVLTASNLSMFL